MKASLDHCDGLVPRHALVKITGGRGREAQMARLDEWGVPYVVRKNRPPITTWRWLGEHAAGHRPGG